MESLWVLKENHGCVSVRVHVLLSLPILMIILFQGVSVNTTSCPSMISMKRINFFVLVNVLKSFGK